MKDKPKTYASPTAFRRALEDRLKQIMEAENVDFQRLLREVAFDRLLARLFAAKDAPWVLKGGYALELRLKEARVTRDIDLALRRALGAEKARPINSVIQQALQDAAGQDLGDSFSFVIGEALQDLDGAPYGGARFPVESILDARTFVKFHIDIGAGDVIIPPLETLRGRDWLAFAGIAAPRMSTISPEQHFAEKLHAYTLPRTRPNTRVRDLVDMVLLINSGKLHKNRTAKALEQTFTRRKTHPVPAELEPPAVAWKEPFAALAQECGLPKDINAAFVAVNAFFARL
jgi:hypothetical protein